MTGPVGRAYAALVAAGELKPDPDQPNAVAALDRFAASLGTANGGFLSRLFAKPATACGVYLWGGVGRGKSMLMDLAYDTIEVEPKRRTHFAPFMIEVHERLRAARATNEADPVIARGRSGVPLDAHVRLLKQTPGRAGLHPRPLRAGWRDLLLVHRHIEEAQIAVRHRR